MNSIKSSITVLFLLFVSYGVYRVIHTPDPTGSASGQFLVGAPKTAEPNAGPTANLNAPPPLVASPNSGNNQASLDSLQLIKPNNPPPPLAAAPGERLGSPPLLGGTTPLLSTSNPATTTQQTPLLPLPIVSDSNNRPAPSSPESSPENSLIATNTAPTNADLGQATILQTSSLEPAAGPLTGSPSTAPPAVGASSPSPLGAALGPATSGSTSPLTAVAQPATPPWEATRTTAIAQVREGQYALALRQLSMLYRAELVGGQREELLTWLDALASRVIYSTENWLASGPYVVQPGETLESVAARWKVAPQLVANVNRAKLPSTGEFVSGLELKSIPGPFHCEIDSTRRELTLFLGDMYAGRFAITPPSDQPLPTGRFQAGKPSRDEKTGQVLFLEIGQGLTLAGSTNALPNSIVLSDADAQDVFGILSAESQVTIVR